MLACLCYAAHVYGFQGIYAKALHPVSQLIRRWAGMYCSFALSLVWRSLSHQP